MQQKPTIQRDGPSDDRATSISGRDRGVSEIIGAILLFGLLILVLTLVQANAVPDANKQLEFQHNERVQGDFVDLDADLEATAATGNGRATVVETGLRYPPRFFLFNPPPAEGAVRTGDSAFTIQHAVAQGNDETADYWDGGAADPDRFVYESRSLSYAPSYNVYAGAPTTTYTHGAVVNRFEDGTVLPVDDAAFVNGRTISLVALDGDRDVSQVDPLSLEAAPLATDTRTVRVTNTTGSPIVITIRTDLSEDDWRELLSEEFTSEGGNVVSVGPGTTSGTVDVTLQQGVTYQLQLAKLGVGPGADEPAAAYVTTELSTDLTADASGGRTLSVEVRDAFNGPQAGVDVTFTTDAGTIDGGSGPVTVTTDDEGEATVEFVPAPTSDATVVARADLNGDGDTADPEEWVEFSVETRGAGDDFTLNPINPDDVLKFKDAVITGSGNDRRIEVTFENTGGDDIRVSEMRMNFYFVGSQGNNPPLPTEANILALDGDPLSPQPQLDIKGSFVSVPWTVESGEETLLLNLEKDGVPYSNNNLDRDFFVLTIIYDDGRASSYIISGDFA